ncbi:MAG: hypothetical protein A2Y17_05655 [Clostridiales bacterium GWF2_38_85]|nr:MAG: hypothetical protein A2Y17_05655 [Clostridiales bacterium GWF2_38_85]HBL84033.1 hypothetical protein [Clostridiales bacterium]
MRKILTFNNFFNIILLISTLFFLISFTIFTGNLIATNNSISKILLPLSIIVFTTLPIILHRVLKKLFRKFYMPLKMLFILAMVLYMVSFLIFYSFVLNYSKNTAEVFYHQNGTDKKIVILVFGCRTLGYTPSQTLEKRLLKAYELLELYPDSVCIVSGAQGADETIAEAEAMQVYLEEKGITPNRIIIEDNATSTIENIRFSLDLINQNHLEDYKLIGVSTEFHVPRIEMYCTHYNINITVIPSFTEGQLHFFGNVVREYMAYFKTLIFDLN